MSTRWMVGVVVAAACSHHEPAPKAANQNVPPNTEATAAKSTRTAAVADEDPAPCDAVARQVIAISRTDGTGTKDVIAMLRGRCIADNWSLDARKCYLVASTWDEGLRCESKLTEFQVRSAEAEINARGSTMGHPAPAR